MPLKKKRFNVVLHVLSLNFVFFSGTVLFSSDVITIIYYFVAPTTPPSDYKSEASTHWRSGSGMHTMTNVGCVIVDLVKRLSPNYFF